MWNFKHKVLFENIWTLNNFVWIDLKTTIWKSFFFRFTDVYTLYTSIGTPLNKYKCLEWFHEEMQSLGMKQIDENSCCFSGNRLP